MPSLRQIEYLVALSETRHFRKAAEKVGVSQPTLSAQLLTLEKRLGVKLVERSRTSVLITPIGEQVLAIGRRIMRDVREIHDLAASQGGQLAGSIRLGLPPTIGPYLLPLMLPELHRQHPDLKLYVREQFPRDLPSALTEGTHDVILTPLPLPNTDLCARPIFREPLYVVVPQDHELARKGYVERADLAGESVLALERGHQLHEQVNALCEEFGAQLLFDYEGTSLDTLHQMVSMGMGLSFLPGLYVKSEFNNRPGPVALELKGRSLYRTIGLAWRRTSAREKDFNALEVFVRNTIKSSFSSFNLV